MESLHFLWNTFQELGLRKSLKSNTRSEVIFTFQCPLIYYVHKAVYNQSVLLQKKLIVGINALKCLIIKV